MCGSGELMDTTLSIRELDQCNLKECLNLIHQSFGTVAKEFGLTKENCPKHTSFIPLVFLEAQMNWGWHMYALCAGKKKYEHLPFTSGYLKWIGDESS